MALSDILPTTYVVSAPPTFDRSRDAHLRRELEAISRAIEQLNRNIETLKEYVETMTYP